MGKGIEGQAKGQKIRLASMSETFSSGCIFKNLPPFPALKMICAFYGMKLYSNKAVKE